MYVRKCLDLDQYRLFFFWALKVEYKVVSKVLTLADHAGYSFRLLLLFRIP